MKLFSTRTALVLLSLATLGAQAPEAKPVPPPAAPQATPTAPKAPAKPAPGKAKRRKQAAPTDAKVKPEVAMMSEIRSSELKKQKAKAAPSGPAVDINHATREELMKIPGVTAAFADRIIAHRPYVSKGELITKGALPYGTYYPNRKRFAAKAKP